MPMKSFKSLTTLRSLNHIIRGMQYKKFTIILVFTCWNVLKEARIDPPIQTLYFLSGGATTLILMLLGARAVISLFILSAMPGNIVDPPLRTMLPYRSFLMSTSHFMIDWYVVSCMPGDSIPTRDGWNSTSGHLNLSAPIVITCTVTII
jgi:hypothetical protein